MNLVLKLLSEELGMSNCQISVMIPIRASRKPTVVFLEQKARRLWALTVLSIIPQIQPAVNRVSMYMSAHSSTKQFDSWGPAPPFREATWNEGKFQLL